MPDDGYTEIGAGELRALRKQAKTARALHPQDQANAREIQFLNAGIDTDDARLKYFVKAYDGDVADPNAIRLAAMEAGFLEPARDPNVVPTEELRQHMALMHASGGADGDTSNEPTIIDKMHRAKSADEIMKILQRDAPHVPTTWNAD